MGFVSLTEICRYITNLFWADLEVKVLLQVICSLNYMFAAPFSLGVVDRLLGEVDRLCGSHSESVMSSVKLGLVTTVCLRLMT